MAEQRRSETPGPCSLSRRRAALAKKTAAILLARENKTSRRRHDAQDALHAGPQGNSRARRSG